MNNKSLFFIGFILLLNLSCRHSEKISTAESSESSAPVIATIGGKPITLDELEANFYRNRESLQADPAEIRGFFPSYIEYRLKLHDGYQKGFNEDSTILAEFHQYASEVAYRYWIENKIKGERIDTFTERFEYELKAFHILKELPEDALPADTLTLFNELLAVRDSLINGAPPGELNERHSSKREGTAMGGQLDWITAGSTIQSFEDAVYSLEPGDISLPVRSQFGYHLIILQDKRPRTPQRLVKHIFVRKKEDETGSKKIDRAFLALQADTSWSDAVSRYSEDPSTMNRDGSLGWVGYGIRAPAELIEYAMEINPDGAYSHPLETGYGYHIMKIDSVRTFANEEQKHEFIAGRLQQLGRLTPDRQNVFDRIASESNLVINRQHFPRLTETEGNKPADRETEPESQKELIRFLNKSYTNHHFRNWLNDTSSIETVMESGDVITSYRNHIIEKNLVEFTKERFPDFAREVDHFLDGLIVFKVNEETVWNPESIDHVELKEYYESNRNQYKTNKTFLYTEISSPADSVMFEVRQKLTQGTEAQTLPEYFDSLTVRHDSANSSHLPLFGMLEKLKPGEFSAPVTVDGTVFIYILDGIIDERILSFDEAFDRIVSNYQPIREEKYIEELSERYNLELYPENLY